MYQKYINDTYNYDTLIDTIMEIMIQFLATKTTPWRVDYQPFQGRMATRRRRRFSVIQYIY